MKYSIRHVGETAVIVVAVLWSLCGDGRLEPGHQLSPRPSAVVHLDALRPGPLPDRSGVQPAHRCPASIPGRSPAAACAPGGSHRAARHARRSCRSRTRCRPAAKRTVRSPLTAVKVIDQQNVYLLSHTCVFRSLAWRWRIGLAGSSRVGCSNTGRLGGASQHKLRRSRGLYGRR